MTSAQRVPFLIDFYQSNINLKLVFCCRLYGGYLQVSLALNCIHRLKNTFSMSEKQSVTKLLRASIFAYAL